MAESELIEIEVVYAKRDRQALVALTVPAGTTALEAVQRSGLSAQFPEMELSVERIGIFGRLCPPDQVLQPGDRVEIYRPLKIDPKEIRRQRAQGHL